VVLGQLQACVQVKSHEQSIRCDTVSMYITININIITCIILQLLTIFQGLHYGVPLDESGWPVVPPTASPQVWNQRCQA
jgi:hypothetical protein